MKHCPNPECSHLADTGRHGEYLDRFTSCSDCGGELAEGEPPEFRPRKSTGDVKWSTVKVTMDLQVGHIGKSALQDADIPCRLWQVRPKEGEPVSQEQGFRLVVPSGLEETARQVLDCIPDEVVALPEGDDLEFVDESGTRIADEEEEEADAEWEGEGGALEDPEEDDGEAEPACPRCGATTLVRTEEIAPDRRPGLFKRLFTFTAGWTCSSCRHDW